MFFSSDSSADGNKERKYWKYIQDHKQDDSSLEKIEPENISSFLDNSNNYKSVDYTKSQSGDMIKEITKNFLAQKELKNSQSFLNLEKDLSLLSKKELDIFDNSIQMNSSHKGNSKFFAISLLFLKIVNF